MSESLKSVFLSHNYRDKEIVRKIGHDLECHGIKIWIDDAEIKAGESLIYKISEGIDNVDYLLAFISPDSINSNWVRKELSVATTIEINTKGLIVIPIIIKSCQIPNFLADKKWIDFTYPSEYKLRLRDLIESIGIVFNKNIFNKSINSNLSTSISKSIDSGLRILPSPFHRPIQYIGMKVTDLEKRLKTESNDVNNIIIKDKLAKMLLEAEGAFINYIEIDLLQTGSHNIQKPFDSEVILGSLSINPSELELKNQQTHFHTYYDHSRQLKIGVFCAYDGAPLSVGIGKKYYGD